MCNNSQNKTFHFKYLWVLIGYVGRIEMLNSPQMSSAMSNWKKSQQDVSVDQVHSFHRFQTRSRLIPNVNLLKSYPFLISINIISYLQCTANSPAAMFFVSYRWSPDRHSEGHITLSNLTLKSTNDWSLKHHVIYSFMHTKLAKYTLYIHVQMNARSPWPRVYHYPKSSV